MKIRITDIHKIDAYYKKRESMMDKEFEVKGKLYPNEEIEEGWYKGLIYPIPQPKNRTSHHYLYAFKYEKA